MFSLSMMVRRAAQIEPGRLATVDGTRSQTWPELEHKIACFAAGLKQLGMGQDGCAAILALNSDRYFEFMFAVPWAGGIFQPVNTRLAGPEVVYWLNDSAASVLFVDTTFVPLVASIRDQLNHVRHLVFIDDGPVPEGYISYADLVNNEPVADADRKNDDVAGLFYTGGTTGRSKGVMLTHKNLCTNALQAISIDGPGQGERMLHVAPMFHIGDAFVCMICTTICGSNYFQPGFDPLATLQGIQDYKIQRLLLVPTMVNMVVYQPAVGDYDVSSLQGVWYGASPMPEAVIRQAIKVWPEVKFIQVYGQTEASPCVTLLPSRRHCFEGPLAGKIKSAGQALPGMEVCIMDENNQRVAAGEVGEVCMRGPNIMKGYRNMEEQTARAIVDGWLHTGDGGYMDEDGFVFIVDRVKDMIISGGENIYSAEVENALYQHESVCQCAVIGIPSEKWGESVHAIVVPKEGFECDEAVLISHCRTLIAGFKCPRSVAIHTEPLPLSGAGKILKTELRKPYWKGVDRKVN